jgi:ribosomal protein S18 acetylase RimI-like enzyme
MQFDTRFAEIGDAQAITGLATQWGYTSTDQRITKCLHEILNNKDHAVFVLLIEKNMVGWIHGIYSLRIESDPFVEIGELIVDKDFRRQGLGKRLVDKIIEWSVFRNCHMIRVRCNIVRKEANAFYNRIGFKEIKQQNVYDMRF